MEISVAARSATAAAAATATATTRPLAVLRFIDLEGAAIEVGTIQRLYGTGRIGVRHLHEGKAARATRLAIGDYGDLLDGSMVGKKGTHGLISRGEGEVTNE